MTVTEDKVTAKDLTQVVMITSPSKSKSLSKSRSKSSSSSFVDLAPLKSEASSVDSVLSEGDLEDIDYSQNPKLYEQELYKIIRKKMPNSSKLDIKKEFDDKMKEIKSKYKK